MPELSTLKSAASTNIAAKEQKIKTRGLDFIIIGVLFLIFLLVPVFFTGLAAQGIGFEKMLLFYFLVLLGTVAWVTKGIAQGELTFKRTPLDWPIVGILVFFIISTILSVSQKDSLIGSYGNSAKSLAAVIVFILFYYLLVNNLNAKRIKILFWSLVGSSALVIAYSLLQLSGTFIFPIDFSRSISFNPLGSLTALTMFLVIVLPLLVVAAAQTKEIHPGLGKVAVIIIKILASIAALGDLVILAILNGFTFWPVAIVGMVIALIFFLSKIIKITNNNLIIPVAAFLILIVLLVLGNFSFLKLNLPAEVSLSRKASWGIAKNSLRADPVFGSGPSTFYYSFSKFKGSDFNASPLWNIRFDNASGLFFEFLASVGALGALAILVIVLIALSVCFLSLIKTKDKENQPILLTLFAGLVSGIVLAALFSLNNSLIISAVIISSLAVSVAIVIYPEKFREVKLSFKASAKYALALAAVFLFVSTGVVIMFTLGLKMYLADVYARRSLKAENIEAKVEKLNKAVLLAPYRDVYYLNLANNYMTLANNEAKSDKDQTKISNYLSLAIEQGKKAVGIAPNKASNNEALALVYENASFYTRGALEWSENLYKKVIELDPDNPNSYLRIALINMARANAETDDTEKEYYINEAIKKYDEAISKKNDLGAAYYGKAIAYERLNKQDKAIEELQKANLSSRNNMDYRFELARLYFNRGVTRPNLSQTASEDITKGEEGEELSVQQDQTAGGVISRNADLNTAEQILSSILSVVPNHANARYSLALLYQKIGETDNAKIMVKSLLDVLQNEQQKEAIKKQFPGLY